MLVTVFGMNVGGVPWTGQKSPELKDGFRNVMFLCFGMLVLILLCFLFPALYTRLSAWRRRRAMRKGWSLNRKSFLKRTIGIQERGGYLRIWGSKLNKESNGVYHGTFPFLIHRNLLSVNRIYCQSLRYMSYRELVISKPLDQFGLAASWMTCILADCSINLASEMGILIEQTLFLVSISGGVFMWSCSLAILFVF